jgi:capsular exopolysaccharide synthesis family protein
VKIKDLFKLLLHNLVFILLGLILGVGIGNYVAENQPPLYEASTKIFVNRTRQQSNADILSISNEQMLAINLQMAKSPQILTEVANRIGSQVDPDSIIVEVIPNSLIIQIKVQDSDSQRAATIANLLVETLIWQNESLLSGFYSGFETAIIEQITPAQIQIDQLQAEISQLKTSGIQEQLNQVNSQIAKIKTEITELEKSIASFPKTLSPVEVIALAEKQAQLDQLHSLMNLYQQIQTNLTYVGKPAQNESGLDNPRLAALQASLDIYQQMNYGLVKDRENIRLARAQSKQNVTQIVAAAVPKNSVRPIPILYILLGGFVGFALTVTVVMLLDHLDESLKSVSQVEELLDLPVMGIVDEVVINGHPLMTLHEPTSAEAQGYYTLGADLEINGVGNKIRTLMIMNAEAAAAPTNIAANLAIGYAQQGKTVVLIDGDLRKPVLHKLFGLENRKGFAELIDGHVETINACTRVKEVNGLSFVAGGKLETDNMRWLDPQKLARVLVSLKNYAEIIIVNSPAAGAADAQVLASQMDAVLLAIQAGHTRLDSVSATLRRFQVIDARVTGIIFYRSFYFPKWRFGAKIKTPDSGKNARLPVVSRLLPSGGFSNILNQSRPSKEVNTILRPTNDKDEINGRDRHKKTR